MPLGSAGEGRELTVPAGRKLGAVDPIQLCSQLWELLSGTARGALPSPPRELPAPRPDALLVVLADPVGDEELRVLRPAVALLRGPHLFLAERLAVGSAGVLLLRAPVADVRVDQDERRSVLLLEECQGRGELTEVVGVGHVGHRPAIGLEALGDVRR
jgi:hypothetical protein